MNLVKKKQYYTVSCTAIKTQKCVPIRSKKVLIGVISPDYLETEVDENRQHHKYDNTRSYTKRQARKVKDQDKSDYK